MLQKFISILVIQSTSFATLLLDAAGCMLFLGAVMFQIFLKCTVGGVICFPLPGTSLRYCFIEFHSVSEAQYWMEQNEVWFCMSGCVLGVRRSKLFCRYLWHILMER